MRFTRTIPAIVAVGFFAVLPPAGASADTITVCADGSGDYTTIQAGIDAAVDGDVVVVAEGTYTGPGNRDLDFSHGLPEGQTRAITVRSTNPQAPEVVAATIIDCEGTASEPHRGFRFHSGEGPDSVIAGLTIINGYAPEEDLGDVYSVGGAVYCRASSPTITNCVINGNTAAGYGGGIMCWYSSAVITNCTVSGNTGIGIAYESFSHATVRNCEVTGNSDCGVYCGWDSTGSITDCTITGNAGTGIWCSLYSSTTITDCMISGNSAEDEGGGIRCDHSTSTIRRCTITGNSTNYRGGGVSAPHGSDVKITHCTISGNSSTGELNGGGGVFSDGKNLTITDVVISDNSAEGPGGGVCCYDGDLTITNCLINGNSSRRYGGGGILTVGDTTVTNCTISGNYSGDDGGGIDAYEPRLRNCTIAGNSAVRSGGAISCGGATSTIANCILWGNSAAQGPEIALTWYQSELMVSYCNVQGGQGGVFVDTAVLVWGDGNIEADPVFAGPGYWDDNGTPDDASDDHWVAGDYRLLAGSPCIDAGDNDAVPADIADLDGDGDTNEPTPLDLEGKPRFADDPATPDTGNGTAPIVDMGPYEFVLVATGWRSVRHHGSLGDLSIELDPAASGNGPGGPAVETRRGSLQKIEVNFSEPVRLVSGAVIEATDSTTGMTCPASSVDFINGGMTLVIDFAPDALPDQTCYTIDLAGAIEDLTGRALAGDTDCTIRSLTGDVNGDGNTNLIDMALIKSRNGADPTVPGNARFDVNVDGNINLIDYALVKARNGGSASCP